jgi:hypothetical protein
LLNRKGGTSVPPYAGRKLRASAPEANGAGDHQEISCQTIGKIAGKGSGW